MENTKQVGRARTRDVAFTYRMNAGSPGDVNRTHPMSIEPVLNDPATGNPLTYFGQPCLIDATSNSVRAINNASDSALGNTSAAIYGVLVRPFPFQDTGAGETYGAAAFGVGGPPAQVPVDVLKLGYIMVLVNLPSSGATAAAKNGKVYVRVATGSGAFAGLPVGGFETTVDTTATNQFTVSNAVWNGPADASGLGTNGGGVAELILRD